MFEWNLYISCQFQWLSSTEETGMFRWVPLAVTWDVWTNHRRSCCSTPRRIAAIFLVEWNVFEKVRLISYLSGGFFGFFPLRGKQRHACSMTSGSLPTNAVDLRECSSNVFTLVCNFSLHMSVMLCPILQHIHMFTVYLHYDRSLLEWPHGTWVFLL